MIGFDRIMRDDRAAGSIEYTLLGAFIGLGILGALLNTRSSVSGAFGRVSTGITMGVNPPIAADRGTPTRTSRTTPWGQNIYTYTYPDGSVGEYTTSSSFWGSYYGSMVSFTDATTKVTTTYSPMEKDAQGNVFGNGISVTNRYADGNTKAYTYYSLDATGTNGSGTTYAYADASGSSSTGSSASTIKAADYQALINQYAQYKANP